MRAYHAGYWVYAVGRRVLRSTGLVKLVRPFVGKGMAKWVYGLSGNAEQPLLIQGHRMRLAPAGDYASPDMVGDRYEPATTRLVTRLVRPGHVVVDVGAHVGYFTLLAAKLTGPQGRVFAFEAAPENFALLNDNLQLNGYRQVTVVHGAVGDSDGPRQLYLSRLDNGFHSLFKLNLPEPSAPAPVTVPGVTLDAYFASRGWPKIDVMKMDIEGGELAAFRGMQELLRRSPALTLVIEFCPWILRTLGTDPADFLTQLQAMGFRLSVVQPDGPAPLAATDIDALIDRLQRRDGYINLVGERVAAEAGVGA